MIHADPSSSSKLKPYSGSSETPAKKSRRRNDMRVERRFPFWHRDGFIRWKRSAESCLLSLVCRVLSAGDPALESARCSRNNLHHFEIVIFFYPKFVMVICCVDFADNLRTSCLMFDCLRYQFRTFFQVFFSASSCLLSEFSTNSAVSAACCWTCMLEYAAINPTVFVASVAMLLRMSVVFCCWFLVVPYAVYSC